MKKYIQKSNAVTVYDLAQDTGTHERTVKRWLKGAGAPYFKVLYLTKRGKGGHQYRACTTEKWGEKYLDKQKIE